MAEPPPPHPPDDTLRTAAPAAPTRGVADTSSSSLSGASDRFGLALPTAGGQGPLQAGATLGGVTLIRFLGAGGMGSVYEGWQEPPGRAVAVKVVHDVLARAAIDRFQQETRILGRLEHPDIARIHTCGSVDTPVGPAPYFVMELVRDARPLTQFAAEQGLSLPQRVRLVSRAAAAINHGHRRGVVHRDLKPGNILVDADGHPKLIDFGVARCTAVDMPHGRAETRAGDVVGTLRYMSPEQLAAAPDAIDGRSDVYALGLILHELLTGQLPYDLHGSSPLEAARIIDAHEGLALRPLTRALIDAGTATGEASGLASIITRCLEREPGDRYQSAADLAADLDRWLAGEPIRARPPTAWESLRRFARRHRIAAAATAVAVTSLLLAVVTVAAFALRSERARRAADSRRAEADREAAVARADAYVANLLLAAEARDGDNLAEARRRLDTARRLSAAAGTTTPIEIDCLAASLDESLLSFTMPAVTGSGGSTTAVAWSADGGRVANGRADGSIWIRSTSPTRPEERAVAGHDGGIWGLAFSPDGRWLASAAADRTVRIWSAREPERDSPALTDGLRLDAHRGAVYGAAFAPDGSLLATASRDGTVQIWDTTTWQTQLTLTGHEGTVYAVAFSAAGDRLATGGQDGTVRLWDPRVGMQQGELRGHDDRVFAVTFAPDGQRLASASEDATVRLWDLTVKSEPRVLHHPRRVNAVAFVGGGQQVATGSADGVLRVWPVVETGEPVVLRGHTGPIWSLAVRPGTYAAVTGSGDGSTRVWDLDETALPLIRGGDRMLAVACSPDGRHVAAGVTDGRILRVDAATLRSMPPLVGLRGRVTAVTFSRDSQLLLAAGDDGRVRGWDMATGSDRLSLRPHEDRVYALDVSPDGQLLATASEDRTVRLWDLAAGAARGEPLRHGRRAFCCRFAPDGRVVATACEDRTARLWHVADGREIRRFSGHTGPVNWVDMTADGKRLATASSDGTVRLWDLADGRALRLLEGPGGQLWKVAFAPDGTRIVAASADGSVRMWDVATGRMLPSLDGHRDQVWAVAFSPDGRSLFTGSWDGTVRAWGLSVADLARRRRAAP